MPDGQPIIQAKQFTSGELEILTHIARLEERITGLERMLLEYRAIASNYVRREEFEPVRAVVYGLVGLIMIGVVGALIGLVVTR